jgi:hypothetical protein
LQAKSTSIDSVWNYSDLATVVGSADRIVARINQSSDVCIRRAVDWVEETTESWTARCSVAEISGITNDGSVSATSGCWIADIICAIVVVITFVCDLATVDRITNIGGAQIVRATSDLSELTNWLTILENTLSCCAFIGSSTVNIGGDTFCNTIIVDTNTGLTRIGRRRAKESVIFTFWNRISVFIDGGFASIIHSARIIIVTVDWCFVASSLATYNGGWCAICYGANIVT